MSGFGPTCAICKRNLVTNHTKLNILFKIQKLMRQRILTNYVRKGIQITIYYLHVTTSIGSHYCRCCEFALLSYT